MNSPSASNRGAFSAIFFSMGGPPRGFLAHSTSLSMPGWSMAEVNESISPSIIADLRNPGYATVHVDLDLVAG